MVQSSAGGTRPAVHELRPGSGRSDPDPAAREMAVLLPYVPLWLRARAWHDPALLRPGAGGRAQGAIAYVALRDRPPQAPDADEPAAAAAQAAWLDARLAPLIDALQAHGGAVAHLDGAGLTAVFLAERQGTATRGPLPSPGHRLRQAIHNAAAAAEAMHAAVPLAQQEAADAASARPAIGISAGALLIGVVGTPAGMRSIVAGAPVERARLAATLAAPGTTRLDPALAEIGLDSLHSVDPPPAPDGDAEETAGPPSGARRHPPADWALLPGATSAEVLARLRAFLPPTLRLDPEQEPGQSVSAACYPVTVLTVRWAGLDYETDPRALAQLQEYCQAVQTAAAPFGGRLAGLVPGAPASTLLLVFGVPLPHAQDAAWALRAAEAIHEHCKLPGIGTQQIGLASGPAWLGSVGSAARREWLLLGDLLERAETLTAAAAPGGILCDEETLLLAGAAPLDAAPSVGDPALPATFDEALDAARGGQGRVVVTRATGAADARPLLAACVARWTAAGGQVIATRGAVEGQSTPYHVWVAVLRACCDLVPGLPAGRQYERLLQRCGELAPEYQEGAPWLADLLGIPRPGAEAPAVGAGPGVAAAQALILAQARRRPLLLILDDLQWADPSSLALLDNLAQRAGEVPLLLVLITRGATPDRLSRYAGALSVQLDAPSGDVPLSALPDLPPLAREVLQCAAVLGTHAPARLLYGLVAPGSDAVALSAALGLLEEAGLLSAAPGADDLEYAFTAGAIQQAAYASMDEATRARRHSAALALLESFYAPDLMPLADRLAYHARQSTAPRDAGPYLHRAGDRAAALYAHAEAAAYYQVALDLLDGGRADPALRVALWQKLAQMQQRTGEYLRAEASLRQALLASPAADWAERAMLYCTISQVREIRGDYPGALAATRLGEAEIAGRPPSVTWARLRLQAGSVLSRQGRYQEALAALDAALPVLQRAEALADLGTAHKVLGNLYQFSGDSEQAQAHYEQSLALRRRLSDRFGSAQVLNNLGNVAWSRGDFPQAQDYYTQALQIARQMGNLSSVASALVNLASVALYRGDLPTALDYNQQSLRLAEQIDKVEGVALAHNGIGETLEALGQDEAALAAHSRALDLGEEIGDFYVAGRAALGLARIYLARRDLPRCRAYLDHIAPVAAASAELEAGCYLILGRLALAERQFFDAGAAFDRAQILAADRGYKLLLAYSRRLHGELELLCGRPDRARAALEQAYQLTTQMGAQFERALALLALARLPAASATPDREARSLLTEAHELLVACGADQYAATLWEQQEDGTMPARIVEAPAASSEAPG